MSSNEIYQWQQVLALRPAREVQCRAVDPDPLLVGDDVRVSGNDSCRVLHASNHDHGARVDHDHAVVHDDNGQRGIEGLPPGWGQDFSLGRCRG